MSTNENDESTDQHDGKKDAVPRTDAREPKKGANESSVSRVESGGTGSSAGELSVDPNRLKGQ